MCLLIVLTLLAAPQAVTHDDDAIHIEVSSDWHVAADDARREADQRLDALVVDLLATFEPDLAGGVNAIGALLLDPHVRRSDQQESRERPFGMLYRETRQVDLPRDSLSRWLDTERHRASVRALHRVLWLVGIVAAWLAFAGWARWYERRTRGYRRSRIVLVAVLLLTASAVILVGFLHAASAKPSPSPMIWLENRHARC